MASQLEEAKNLVLNGAAIAAGQVLEVRAIRHDGTEVEGWIQQAHGDDGFVVVQSGAGPDTAVAWDELASLVVKNKAGDRVFDFDED
jgi:hypothetical protein